MFQPATFGAVCISPDAVQLFHCNASWYLQVLSAFLHITFSITNFTFLWKLKQTQVKSEKILNWFRWFTNQIKSSRKLNSERYYKEDVHWPTIRGNFFDPRVGGRGLARGTGKRLHIFFIKKNYIYKYIYIYHFSLWSALKELYLIGNSIFHLSLKLLTKFWKIRLKVS